MPVQVIKSRLKTWPADKPSFEVNYDMPDTLSGLVEKFGEEVVAAKCIDSLVIDIQANVRRALAKEGTTDAMTPEAIKQKISEFKPSTSTSVRRIPVEKIGDLLGKMSAEEKKALLKQLKEAA